MFASARLAVRFLLLLATILLVGCGSQNPPAETTGSKSVVSATVAAPPLPPVFEATAEDLMTMRLVADEAAAGWVRLFDGYTFFGWEMASAANWRVEDHAILADAGDSGLLCTSVAWCDFELKLQFKSDAETNSGIFLRSPLEPTDAALDCYEVNIAPPSKPFPSGSVVNRAKVADGKPGSESSPLTADQWHDYEMTMDGDLLTIKIDGEQTSQYRDPKPLGAKRIGLQFRTGKIAFRDIKLRPLNLKPMIDEKLSLWTTFPDKPGEFEINDDGHLHVTGGRGQSESKAMYANSVTLVEAKTLSDKLNSGLFFRCIPGSNMDGYECQINNGIIDNNPLKPVDCGTGGIFRRQNARIVLSNDLEWFSMLFVADGTQFCGWVNGVQVSDWKDNRNRDVNPRNGSRVEAGSIMVQAHDPTTDILFRKIDAAELVPFVVPHEEE